MITATSMPQPAPTGQTPIGPTTSGRRNRGGSDPMPGLRLRMHAPHHSQIFGRACVDRISFDEDTARCVLAEVPSAQRPSNTVMHRFDSLRRPKVGAFWLEPPDAPWSYVLGTGRVEPALFGTACTEFLSRGDVVLTPMVHSESGGRCLGLAPQLRQSTVV